MNDNEPQPIPPWLVCLVFVLVVVVLAVMVASAVLTAWRIE